MAEATSIAESPARHVSALRYPNYRRWFVGQTLSLMGTWMQSVAAGLAGLRTDRLQAGARHHLLRRFDPDLFLMLPAGVMIDRMLQAHAALWSCRRS